MITGTCALCLGQDTRLAMLAAGMHAAGHQLTLDLDDHEENTPQ